MFILDTYACGDINVANSLLDVVSTVVFGIQVFVPVALIILGMLDFGKAVMAQKEDEIKKGQQTFIKRLIAAALVFFVVAITTLVVDLAAGDTENGEDNIMNCVNCFIKGSDDRDCQ